MEIGNAAGIIWRYLDQHGETALSKLKQGTGLSTQPLLMGVGWLAKEGKLILVKEGKTMKLSVKRNS